MMEKTKKIKDLIDQYTLDYKVIEMKKLLEECKPVVQFFESVEYYRSLDLDMIYEEYKSVFVMRNQDVSEFKDN